MSGRLFRSLQRNILYDVFSESCLSLGEKVFEHIVTLRNGKTVGTSQQSISKHDSLIRERILEDQWLGLRFVAGAGRKTKIHILSDSQ